MDVKKLVQLRKKAEQAVDDMPYYHLLKAPAFDVIFRHLIYEEALKEQKGKTEEQSE